MNSKLLIGLFAMVLLSSTNSIFEEQNDNQKIIGTWVSEKDSNWKMVFTSNDCKWYYNDVLSDTYQYSLSNSSPQCGEDVYVGLLSNYLQLINQSDPSDKMCYEIYNLGDGSDSNKVYLSLRFLGTGKPMVFVKQ